MGDERTNEPQDQRGHGTKRKATSNALAAANIPTSGLKPTQHPPPPIASPSASFQVPAAPRDSKPVPLAPKVAIPRLPRTDQAASPIGSVRAGEKHRVNHACEPCRHRKTKCSGERPSCKHCEDFKISCVYADGKRDRVKKEFHHMSAKVDLYHQLLMEISPTLDASTQARIKRALEKELDSDDEEIQSATSVGKVSFSYGGHSVEADGESQVSAGVGSTGSLDRINEDFNRSTKSRETGFMGKISEITWLHRLQNKLDHQSPPSPPGPELDGNAPNTQGSFRASQSVLDEGVADSTYHCDDYSVIAPDQVEMFELPPRPIAEFLLHTYIESVHPTFPVIGKLNFRNQVQNFFNNEQSTPGKSWLAILNLIFAIAAKYSHLVQAELRGDERDHLIYFTRARLLGMDSESILALPDLQRVQIAGLMSFYLMSVNQINRAWTMCGLAMRYSVALGLHLRNENPRLPDTAKEIRYRVWWAIFGLERTLGVMTGRPTSVVDIDCMTPIPLPIDEEAFRDPNSSMHNEETVRRMRRLSSHDLSTPSSGFSPRNRQSPSRSSTSPTSQHSSFDLFKNVPPTLSLYFTEFTLLSTVTHDVMGMLYRPSAVLKTWSQIQTTIANLDKKLERWRSGLPSLFDFTKRQRDQQFNRQRMCLGFFYYSAKIIMHRPCLCRIEDRIPNESQKSKDFNRTAAATCVQAARGMLELIPPEPNPVGLYKVSPWWCLTHHLTQAATVLIMELFFRSEHMPHEAQNILADAKKVVRWLNQMAKESVSAARAWKHCNELLRRVAPMIGHDADDMPTAYPGMPLGPQPAPTQQRTNPFSQPQIPQPDGWPSHASSSRHPQPDGLSAYASSSRQDAWPPHTSTSSSHHSHAHSHPSASSAGPSTSRAPSFSHPPTNYYATPMGHATDDTDAHLLHPTMYNAFDEYMPFEMGLQSTVSTKVMAGIFSGTAGMGFFEGGGWDEAEDGV
ncbi:hypothetical protein MMC30_002784 [Trapelia coarctata]|nr:hypothetical protein [Trapelia coarctata]